MAYEKVGDFLRHQMNKEGIEVRELARRLRCQPSQVRRWLRRYSMHPRPFMRLVSALWSHAVTLEVYIVSTRSGPLIAQAREKPECGA